MWGEMKVSCTCSPLPPSLPSSLPPSHTHLPSPVSVETKSAVVSGVCRLSEPPPTLVPVVGGMERERGGGGGGGLLPPPVAIHSS